MIEEPLGTLQCPIIILSEEEELMEFNKKIQEVTNKALIEEAIMIGQPLSVMSAVVKQKILGNLAIKNQTMEQEILEYYHQKLNIKINSQFFTPRLEPNYSNPDTKPNLTEFVLYGVDFLSTNQIRDHFVTISEPQLKQQNQLSSINIQKTHQQQLEKSKSIVDMRTENKNFPLAKPYATVAIKRILWINDSSCKLIFKSPEDARLILNNQIKDQSKFLKNDEQGCKDWLQLKPYSLYSFQRPLFIRYSTTMERGIIKSLSDKYSVFEKAQSLIIPEFLKKYQVEEKYNEILKQIQLEKSSKHKRHQSSQPRVRSRDTNKPNNFAQCQQMPAYRNNYKKPFNNNNFKNSNQQDSQNKNFNKDQGQNNRFKNLNGENASTENKYTKNTYQANNLHEQNNLKSDKGNNGMEDQNNLSLIINKDPLVQENDSLNISIIGNNLLNSSINENVNMSFTLNQNSSNNFNSKMVEQSLEMNSSLKQKKQLHEQKQNKINEKMIAEEKEYENILPPQLLDQKQNQMDVEVQQKIIIDLDQHTKNANTETLNNDFLKQICQIEDIVKSEKQQQRNTEKNQNLKVEDKRPGFNEIKPKLKLQTIQKVGQIIINPKAQNKINTTENISDTIQTTKLKLKQQNEAISVNENMKSTVKKEIKPDNQVKDIANPKQGVVPNKQVNKQKQCQIKQTQDNKNSSNLIQDTMLSTQKQEKSIKEKETIHAKKSQALSNPIKQKEVQPISNAQDAKQKKSNSQEEYKWNILQITSKNSSNSAQQSYQKTDNRSFNKDEKNYGNKNQSYTSNRRDNKNSVPQPEDHGEPISY